MMCLMCGEETAKEVITDTQFEYGESKPALLLRVTLPVIFCSSCDLGYTDGRSELIREKAVINYLDAKRIQQECDHDWEDIDNRKVCTYNCGAEIPTTTQEGNE